MVMDGEISFNKTFHEKDTVEDRIAQKMQSKNVLLLHSFCLKNFKRK